jgi:hypothetical protein
MVKQVPEYNETAASRTSDGLLDLEVPYEASFGQDPRASKPQRAYKTPEEFEKQRAESIANYYGFPTAEAHAAAKKNGWTPYSQSQQATRKAEPTTAHVGTDPLVRPGGPEVSVRSVVAPSALTPHDFTKPATPAAKPPSPASHHANSAANGVPRKPATPVKEALATGKSLRTIGVGIGQR